MIDRLGIDVTKVVQTCPRFPSQWDCWDADGNYYYVRFRHGWLSVATEVGVTDPHEPAHLWSGTPRGEDDLTGEMSWDEVEQHTGLRHVTA